MRVQSFSKLAVWVVLSGASLGAAASWEVRKQDLSNACFVQEAAAPALGKTLSAHPNYQAACTAADRALAGKECSSVSAGTIAICRSVHKAFARAPLSKRKAEAGSTFSMRKPSNAHDLDIKPWVVGGAPADPAKFPATLVFDGKCTSTIVGSKAILTAAHCVANGATGTVDFGGGQRTAVCTRHPDYVCSGANTDLSCTADVALCLASSNLTSTGLKYETIQIDRTKIKAGDPIVLVGYGCTSQGGQDFGALYVGSSKIAKPSKPSPVAFADYFLEINQLAHTCPGDSGAGNFDGVEPRKLIAITKRGDASTMSQLVQVSDKRVVDFMKTWAQQNAAQVCGVTTGATGCR